MCNMCVSMASRGWTLLDRVYVCTLVMVRVCVLYNIYVGVGDVRFWDLHGGMRLLDAGVIYPGKRRRRA